MNRFLSWRGLAASMQLKLGSTRALACSDRRLASRNGCVNPSLNGDWFGCADVVGEGADHGTRVRVRSPSHLNRYGLVVGLLLWAAAFRPNPTSPIGP